MQCTSVAPWQICYYYPIPKRFHCQHLHLFFNKRIRPFCFNSPTQFARTHFLPLSVTNNCTSEQDRKKRKKKNSNLYPNHRRVFLEEFYSSTDDDSAINQSQKRQSLEGVQETESEVKGCEIISTNMWWADVKAALGQRINYEGIMSSVAVVARDRHLALPHISVPDIRYIDWAELKRSGFRGVIFDKDNTITAPYSLTLWAPLGSSLDRCKSVFGNDIAVFSNSAGLYEFDPDGMKARALEGAIGIKVIRHRVKKPAGTADEIEEHFGCESSRLLMVGDRPFTDIVYGNRNGFFTILTEPLSLAEEPSIVKEIRRLEIAFVNWWSKRGLKPTSHELLPDAIKCVTDPPPL
ncbi:Phosphatidylglycerophosphate phosphatase 1, chloroplastic/mitochondrial [Sarracenia purpurea var. burkii]